MSKVKTKTTLGSVSDLEEQLWQWHVEHYGEGVDFPATYRKLLEEVGELGESLMEDDEDEARMEAGDCAVVLLVILRGLGQGMFSAMQAVMDKLESRRVSQAKRTNVKTKTTSDSSVANSPEVRP